MLIVSVNNHIEYFCIIYFDFCFQEGNYGYFCGVHDSLEDLFFLLCIASCWEDSNGWLTVHFFIRLDLWHEGRDFKHSLLIYPQKEK